MPSEPGQDRPAGPAAAPRRSRAGQVAVVTGGSAGLGLAIAAALTRAGTTVVLASRSAGRCAAAAEQLSARTGATVHGRVGLDYSIWLACGLGSSLGDLLGGLLARPLPARLPDGAGPA
jgi:NAD(P)-dependent dehydrogenase (short-subunit alcohol dehydrogenase family)